MFLQTLKFVACKIPRCEVKKFEKGKEMLIEHWILQIETYFITLQIPVKQMVGIMVKKIALKISARISVHLVLVPRVPRKAV